MDLIKFAIEKFLYPLMEARRGNQVRANLRWLQDSERRPAHELKSLREEKLRRLLLHCVEHVPAYRQFKELVPQIVADPMAALRCFPVLTKEAFRLDPESFIADDADRSALIANNSGGSSGQPVQFFMDRRTVEFYEAARWRGLGWYGITPGSRSLLIWGNPFELDKLAERRYRLTERYLKNRRIIPAYALDPAAMPQHWRLLHRYRPEYIYGYAGALTLFARLLKEQNLPCRVPLKAVVSTSETLHPWQRELLEEVFAAPVVNEYGARDGGIIAYQCPAGGMHLSAENLIAEVADILTGELLPPGERGLLLVTDLNNFSQPRLRYQLGDEVIAGDHPCSCGRVMPLLEEICGREDDIFLTTDGRFVHGVAFANCIKRLPEVEAFQIVQLAPDEAKVLLVTRDGQEPPGLDGVKADYQALLPGTRISYQLVDKIPPSASGKIRYAVRQFPLPHD